jgi:hypothetical protein
MVPAQGTPGRNVRALRPGTAIQEARTGPWRTHGGIEAESSGRPRGAMESAAGARVRLGRPTSLSVKKLRTVLRRRQESVRYLDHVVGRGRDLFQAVCRLDLEGVVAKARAETYGSDPRTTTWVKIENAAYTQARDRHELFERRAAFR